MKKAIRRLSHPLLLHHRRDDDDGVEYEDGLTVVLREDINLPKSYIKCI